MSENVPFWVKIVCVELATDTVVWEKETDYNKQDCRSWLLRTFVWAWTNGKSIEVYNKNDEKLIDKVSANV